jgi:hypothetical protein
MKFLFAILSVIAFAGVGYAQDTKVIAESIRSTERIVKGAPFSAEATGEAVQVLPDGNRISRRTTSRLFRDTEGRFRREDMPKQLGVPGAVIDMPERILMIDPVAGYKYELNSKNNTARQFQLKQAFDFKLKNDRQFKWQMKQAEQAEKQAERAEKQVERTLKEAGLKDKRVEMKKRAEITAERAERAAERERKIGDKHEIEKPMSADAKPEGVKVKPPSSSSGSNSNSSSSSSSSSNSDNNVKTESLGVQNIEGVDAEGTRTTTTIPAGAIGNERAIDVVYEKWYSKDLQLIVLSKHNDPRFGEQTYRLTNISRTNPPISLFSPPADYKIINEWQPRPPKFNWVPKEPAEPVPSTPSKSNSMPKEPVKSVPGVPSKPSALATPTEPKKLSNQ